MRLSRFPRLTRLLVLLALCQAIAPEVAAIADAWRIDERTPHAHVESETDAGCVLVHQGDCALCPAATTPAMAPSTPTATVPAGAAPLPSPRARVIPHAAAVPRCASQRAPPAGLG
jgi:hypothetical protein